MKKLIIIFWGLFFQGCALFTHKVKIPNIDESKYPGANAIIVFDSTFFHVKKSGKYRKRQHVLVKILTMKGKADFSTPSFTYTTKYGKISVRFARVIKRSGKVIKVKKENIKDVKMPAFGKFFLPNVRMVKITFPDVERGDAIEYEVIEDMKNPPMEGEFDDLVLFESREPVLSRYYEVNIPKKMHYKIYNDPDKVIKFIHKGSRYIFYAEDIKPLIEEPMMPPIMDIGKKVLLATVDSWKKWSVWYWNLVKDKLVVNDTMKTTMDSLLQNTKTRMDTMKALFYYVSNKVRYVATTMNGKKLGYEPFPAPKTFRQKYGVCRDKAALLVAMYRHLGIDAYPVLTNPMMKVEKDVPVDQFNHAIVAVKEKNKYIYLDPTAENIPNFLPFYEEGKGVLVCTPQGETLSYTPMLPPDSNTIIGTGKTFLDSMGNVRGSVVITGTIADQQLRMVVKKIPHDRLKSMMQMNLQGIGKETTLDTFYYTDPDNFDIPFALTFKYSARGFALKKGKNLIFSLSNQNISFGNAEPFSLERRRYPLYFFVPVMSKAVTTIYLPKKYKVVRLPRPYRGENDYLAYAAKCNAYGDSIVCVYENVIKKPLVPPEDYVETKKLYDEGMKFSKTRIILKRED